MASLIITFMLAFGWSAEKAIQEELRSHYPWHKIVVSDIKSDGELPDAELADIQALKGSLGRMVFLFSFRNGKTARVTAQVRAYDWVVKSKIPIERGTVLDENSIYRELMDIKRIPKGAFSSTDQLNGMITTHGIGANRVLSNSDVQMIPVIKKGQRVAIVYQKGGLRITTHGTAKENGYIGRQVRVENSSSGRVISGQLINDNTVKVGF